MRRWPLLVVAAVVVLVGLYASAGYWVAPRFIEKELTQRAQAAGLDLRLARVRSDPFRLSVELDGVELRGKNGDFLGSAKRASAQLAWSSLTQREWIVQSASLEKPELRVVRGPKGHLNWSALGSPDSSSRKTSSRPVAVQSFRMRDGAIHYIDRTRSPAAQLSLNALELNVHQGRYDLSGQIEGGGTLASQGSVALEPFSAQGNAKIDGALLSTVWSLAMPQSGAGGGKVSASANYRYAGDRISLSDARAQVSDFAYEHVRLAEVTLEAPKLDLASRSPFPLSARAKLASGGEVNAHGTLALSPLGADAQVSASNVKLAEAAPFLPRGWALTIASGEFSGQGALRLGSDSRSFEGKVEVSDLRVDDKSGNLLFGLAQASTDNARLQFAPFSARLGEVLLKAPSARLEIDRDRTVNVVKAIRSGAPVEAQGPTQGRAQVFVERVRIADGTLDFTDRSLPNAFHATMRDLAGAVNGIKTTGGPPALVQIDGRVFKYGSVRIRGTVDLEHPKSLANIRASFRNLALAAFTPYIVRFAGYRVTSGRLSADLRYRVRDARLVGDNTITIEALQLGERVQRPGVRDLPIRLAVAVLADAQGRINLGIPVSGNLNDPRFDFGALFGKAFRNIITRIVTAPFQALARLFGGGTGESPAQVRFAPGSTEVRPPEEQSISQIAKALAARPQLELTVRGGFDPQADVRGLARGAARREIASRAGLDPRTVSEPGAFDPRDPKVVRAAESVYLAHGGTRSELSKIRAEKGAYVPRLIDAIAGRMQVDPEALRTLATARAETVRAALLVHGVDPKRVRVEQPQQASAGKEGVPTALALNANAAQASG